VNTPQTLSAPELQRWLEQGSPLQLVDVREHQELLLARLPHPVLHLPLSRSAEWLGDLPQALGRDQPIVVLCHAGIRSWQFASWLIDQQGYSQVWNLSGGIEAWSLEVDASVPRY
jgi:rhodanese-related sulfurtransferase